MTQPRELVSNGQIRLDAHVFNVLEAISEVANKGMIHMLEHATLSYNVSYAF